MAKTPKKPKMPARTKPGAKSAKVKEPKPPAGELTNDEEAKARLKAERDEIYQANKKRIDGILAKCIKHFNDDEPAIVRAVGRMLFDYYSRKRMKTKGPSRWS
jgi:hypothetical protein